MATWYKTDGTVKKIDIPVAPKESLALMQKCLGGYMEVIHRHESQIYLGNEEGRLLNLPRNPFFAVHFYGDVLCVQTPEEFDLNDERDFFAEKQSDGNFCGFLSNR